MKRTKVFYSKEKTNAKTTRYSFTIYISLQKKIGVKYNLKKES
jgi:hypothetical protein